MAEGRTRYFTGKPCPAGHLSERMVSTRACLQCIREKKADWLAANPEKSAAQKRAYVHANPEKVKQWKAADRKRGADGYRQRQRKWYAENREQANAASAAWAKAHPGAVAARAAKRRASELRATPAWADLDLIADLYTLASIYREHASMQVEVDHIVPLQGKSVCGLHVQDNLQIIPSVLNKSKSNLFAF